MEVGAEQKDRYHIPSGDSAVRVPLWRVDPFQPVDPRIQAYRGPLEFANVLGARDNAKFRLSRFIARVQFETFDEKDDGSEFRTDDIMGSLRQALAARQCRGLVGFFKRRRYRNHWGMYTDYGVSVEEDGESSSGSDNDSEYGGTDTGNEVEAVRAHQLVLRDRRRPIADMVYDLVIRVIKTRAPVHVVFALTDEDLATRRESADDLCEAFRYVQEVDPEMHPKQGLVNPRNVAIHVCNGDGVFSVPDPRVQHCSTVRERTDPNPFYHVFVVLIGQTGIPGSVTRWRKEESEPEFDDEGEAVETDDDSDDLELPELLRESLWNAIQMDAVWRVIVRYVDANAYMDRTLVSLLGGDKTTRPHPIADHPLYDTDAMETIYEFLPSDLKRTRALIHGRMKRQGALRKRQAPPMSGTGSISRLADD